MAGSNSLQTNFSIGDVVHTLEGSFPEVTPSALRFLEKEGLITPKRSPGGHRTYSLEDVEQIRTIKRWQRKHLTLDDIRNRLASRVTDAELRSVVPEISTAVQMGDIPTAVKRLNGLLDSGTSLLALCDEVLAPVLWSLGAEWHASAEHVDRQLEFDQALRTILAHAVSERPPAEQPLIVLAATPRWERHDFALTMVLALLRERGAHIHYLGTTVEARFVVNAAIRLQPDILLTSVTLPLSAADSDTWFREVHNGMPDALRLSVIGGVAAGSIPSNLPRTEIATKPTFAETIALLDDIARRT